MRHKETNVPFYGLYGDRLSNNDPGFVHIEDIAERSKGLDWTIKPHRHNRLFQILCIFEGKTDIRLQEENHTLEGSWAVTIPVGVTHGFRFQTNSEGFVLSITDSVLGEEIQQGFGKQNSDIFQTPHLIDLASKDAFIQKFLNYIHLIKDEFKQHSINQSQSLALLSRLALLTLNRQLQNRNLRVDAGKNESLILIKFRTLIECHYHHHWSVSDYAKALHVSPSTLTRLSQKNLGNSPKQLVQDRVLTEAKRRLMHTQQSIEEIAFTLGFKDYPYFSRFFKKLTNVTAGVYRKQSDEARTTNRPR